MPGLFVAFVSPDSKESDKTITYLSQGGLGLPNESYYREPSFEPLRKAYVAHIGRMLALVKFAEPEKAAERIMAIETAIAKGHWDNVRSRDADKTYNKMSHSQLKELAANIDWDTWFHGVGGPQIPEVVVRQPSFFTNLAKTLGQFPLDDWKTYLTWRVVSSQCAAPVRAVRQGAFRVRRQDADGHAGNAAAVEARRRPRRRRAGRGGRQALRRASTSRPRPRSG